MSVDIQYNYNTIYNTILYHLPFLTLIILLYRENEIRSWIDWELKCLFDATDRSRMSLYNIRKSIFARKKVTKIEWHALMNERVLLRWNLNVLFFATTGYTVPETPKQLQIGYYRRSGLGVEWSQVPFFKLLNIIVSSDNNAHLKSWTRNSPLNMHVDLKVNSATT